MKTKNSVSRYKGCNVLLISESKEVLSSQIDGKGSSIFSVEALKEEEAEMLFKKLVGIDDKKSEFKNLVAPIANKFYGLPGAIAKTAKALKNQSLFVWENTLQQLQSQKLTEAPEFSTKLSYGLLENEELKNTFLLCARMGHDALIMDLVRYCMGLGLLQGIHTIREARVRVHALVRRLKESGLLSESYSSDRFSMEDIVCSAALSIASEAKHVFLKAKEKLDEWPDGDELERYTVISLQRCDIIEEFPQNMKFPRLRVFHVDSNDPSLNIPDDLFKEMKELRVLILTGINLSPLPSSIKYLAKLKMLCLERCRLGGDLSIIGKLQKLKILSFSGSEFENLPDELKHLTMLQILDISHCSRLGVIPHDAISSLTSLEELYMRDTSIQWKVEENGNQKENASLSELRYLNQLTTLEIHISNVAHLPKNLFFDKLDNYKIVIGDFNDYLVPDFKVSEKYEASRFLALQLKDGNFHCQKGIKMLFERVESLLLGQVSGVKDVFYELNMEGFPYLKHLSIVSNSGIESIINSKDKDQEENAFPKLESLCLHKVEKMEQPCYNELTDASFRKLKTVKIMICGHLKHVFMFSMVRLLSALETIEVSECHSLKDIVVVNMETQSDTPEILFPALRSLALKSLPKFVGFYSREPPELFDKKVKVPKLEKLKLSSIKIQNIWSDHLSLASSLCENLISLDVNDCGSLTYLLSYSIAKKLVNLQSLFLSECEMMKNIFKEDEDKDSKDKILPKLKDIRLRGMNNLETLWPSRVPKDSFGKLETLTIDKCGKLKNVFPSHMVGRFGSLCNLRVTNCKSMEEIFDVDRKREVWGASATNLQHVHLTALPSLKYVWNKDPKGILNLKNLQKISVHKCHTLKNIFRVSVAKSLEKLEYLKLWDCRRLHEIIAMEKDKKKEGEGNENSSSISFEFPALTSIALWGLPELDCFYGDKHTLSFSTLSAFSVKYCDKLEPFRAVTSAKEVIYNLKSMEIVPRDENWFRNSTGNHRTHKLEEFGVSGLVDTKLLHSFLHRNPNLKCLSLHHCDFEELVPHNGIDDANENLGVVPKLKSLKLFKLHSLKNIGFERDMILQRIESLIADECPGLITLVPSSVSFIYLTNLQVLNCNGLKNLMAPSTAKSLVQLTTMKVSQCERMEEIVSVQGNEVEIIVFKQLKALELSSLKKLESFCSSKSCEFDFPSLEKLVVSGCPNMQKFSDRVKGTRVLQKIFLHAKELQRRHWKDDINATIQQIYEDQLFWEGMDVHTVVDETFSLQVLRCNVGLQGNPLPCLKTLKLEHCNSQPHAILSDVLPHLKNLKELQVRNCINMKGIFERSDTDMDELKRTSFQLKKLTLEGLPNLTQVWDSDNVPGILNFQNLQQVRITRCEKLEILFPAQLAKKLKKLETLEITNCAGLREVVAAGKEEEEEAKHLLSFPHLTRLQLYKLPQLTCFYKSHTLECLELDRLEMKFCGKLALFQSLQEAHPQGQGTSISANRQPLFLDHHKVITNLASLTLSWKDTMTLSGELSKDHQILHKLSKLRLCFDDVKEEVSTLPIEFLEKAPNLEYLQVSDCKGLKEVFPSQEPQVDEGRSLFKYMKTLCLVELKDLKSIGLEHSWLNAFYEKLHHFIVINCPCLTKLIDSARSFSNLKQLVIQKCDRLGYLFTSSTAKKLVYLEEMKIVECKSMTTILEEMPGETTSVIEIISFVRLSKITLESLPKLEWFYSGTASLKFSSSLQKVIMVKCPEMKTFSHGVIHAESFRGIQVLSSDPNHHDLFFHHDLNATVQEWLRFQQQEHLILGDCPMLKRIWLKKIPVPDRGFSKLISLVMEGCEFLLDAILPSHILPFLSNLKELKVRKCKFVTSIFDHTSKTITKTGPVSSLSLPMLNKLTLEQLPMLKHIWKIEDLSKESLSLPNLEEVSVDECDSIRSLFPAPLAKDTLKVLDVGNCKGLVEIVAKDDESVEEEEEAAKELTMFRSLTLLKLRKLKSLECIYPKIHNLEWPELNGLEVYGCPKLKVFASEVPNCTDSHSKGPEGQDCFPTEQKALVLAEKVTPRLELLSLSKEDTEMIEQGQLHVDLQKVKFLKLHCFHDESDIFPYIFLSKVRLDSIEKLGLVDCTIQEIFPSQRPEMDVAKILSRLNGLDLNYLPMLNSIGLEHSWVVPFLGNLRNLSVYACNGLKILAPSTVSFFHLTQLIVHDCHGLKYLFTSATAQSLCLLKKMDITNCESIEEIVAKDQRDKPEEADEIILGGLNVLSLENLPKLGSFYSGNSTLKFPYLENVLLTECHRMKLFCHSYLVPKHLQRQRDGVGRVGHHDTAIQQEFKEGISTGS